MASGAGALPTKNPFAALVDTKKVKKSSSKSKGSSKEDKKKKAPKPVVDAAEAAALEKAIFSQPLGLGLSSWADDEDDDDFVVVSLVGGGWSGMGVRHQVAGCCGPLGADSPHAAART